MWEKTHTSGGRNVVSLTGMGTQRRHTGGVQECRFFFTQNKEESGPETAECVRTSIKRAQRPLHSLTHSASAFTPSGFFLQNQLLPSLPTPRPPAVRTAYHQTCPCRYHRTSPCRTYSVPPDSWSSRSFCKQPTPAAPSPRLMPVPAQPCLWSWLFELQLQLLFKAFSVSLHLPLPSLTR